MPERSKFRRISFEITLIFSQRVSVLPDATCETDGFRPKSARRIKRKGEELVIGDHYSTALKHSFNVVSLSQ
jgi:hypothetical protein